VITSFVESFLFLQAQQKITLSIHLVMISSEIYFTIFLYSIKVAYKILKMLMIYI